jgi:serine/threonine protein kinase/Flp pilus assembly protein TadD
MPEIRAVHDGERGSSSFIMSSAARVCRKCGAGIFADAPEGLCTACLFETGLSLLTNERQPTCEGGSASPKTIHALGERVPPQKGGRKLFADFGDYELLELIGRGGQGVVYRARQKSLNRTVALKVIGLGHWAADAHVKRFRREAEAAASLDHSGIVPIYEVGERDGSCYFSMKFVEGGQLDEVARAEPMPVRRAVELIAKVARTVHYAHEHGILHRDIKPGNILLDQKGEPHLTDFGLARLVETESTVTRTMEVLGTPSYMAPEQAVGNNKAISSVTDVYGLGAVLYQLLTGHPPFAGGTTYETIKLLLDTEPRQPRLWNSKIDRDLSTICLKCLEKDPKRRYPSALALAEDLERWVKHEPILARRSGIFTRGKKWVQRNPTSALLAASLVALAVAAGWIISKSDLSRRPLTTGIAVLPFENLSGDQEHAYFADGVQDDILTKLAKIADLKVISRSSVMQYRGKQDVRQIGNALRVSHVLEGTVRRSGNKLHVNAQLVDTRTDEDIWADEYDRNLNDVFAMETEVAQSIANRLRAKVSAREKAAMEEWPSKDLVAYDHYIQAASLINMATYESPEQQKSDYLRAIELLGRAIARDSNFLLAYCRLAEAHDELYFMEFDHTASRLALAKSAIDSAFRLKPDAGEAHLALALHVYHGYLDYDRARRELAIAERTLPNNPRIFELSGYIDRRQGRWHEAAREFENAIELDPQNVKILISAAVTNELMRNYVRERAIIDRLITLEPNNIEYRARQAGIAFCERADTRPLHDLNETRRGLVAWYERNANEVERVLAALGDDSFGTRGLDARGVGGARFSRLVLQGLVARMKGDVAAAQQAFIAARALQEKTLRGEPDYGPTLCILGLIDAALGRKGEALKEGRRAVALARTANDSFDTADVLYFYAVICAWTGEADLAIEQLRTLAKTPGGVSYGDIRLNFYWDSLRGDPRFEKIAQSLAPQ